MLNRLSVLSAETVNYTDVLLPELVRLERVIDRVGLLLEDVFDDLRLSEAAEEIWRLTGRLANIAREADKRAQSS